MAQYTDNSTEAYVTPTSAPDIVFERVTTQWFATAGSFPDQPPGGTAVQSFKLDRKIDDAQRLEDAAWAASGTAMTHRSFVMQ